MSHGSDEGENYWPGYVDALTSMVQVLAFVMMLLSMAVFVLSQNAAKNAISAIAKAEKVNMPKNATVGELTDAVIEKIRSRTAPQGALAEARRPNQPPADPGKAPPNENSAAAAASMAAAGKHATLPKTASSLVEANRLIAAVPFDKQPPSAVSEDKRLSVRFQDRSYELDPKEAASIASFLEKQQAIKKNASFGVRAYAYSGVGLTEERRIAYYRALVVRAALIERKILASRLQINVFDTVDPVQGATVDIFLIEPGAR